METAYEAHRARSQSEQHISDGTFQVIYRTDIPKIEEGGYIKLCFVVNISWGGDVVFALGLFQQNRITF